MLMLAYGHGQIEIGSEVYTFVPSFLNISKIGEPHEIINTFKNVIYNDSVWSFNDALNVLNCCCDKELPTEFTGHVARSDWSGNSVYVAPRHGVNVYSDIINLAIHCLKHGITGVVDYDIESDGEPSQSFDAYEYIELATEIFKCSIDEAAKMTMTEFLRRLDAKFPERKKEREEKLTKQQEVNLLKIFEIYGSRVH